MRESDPSKMWGRYGAFSKLPFHVVLWPTLINGFPETDSLLNTTNLHSLKQRLTKMSVESILTQILSRLSVIETKIALGGGSGGGGAAEEGGADLPPSVAKFDSYLAEFMGPFVASCNALGGDCAVSGAGIEAAWEAMRAFLLMASACKAPADADLMGLLMVPGGVAEKMKAVSGNVKRGDHERHCKALMEAVGAMNWLCVKPAPVDLIESAVDGFNFIGNKLRMEFKGKDEKQIAFCDASKGLFGGLVDYVKTHHRAGLKWNPNGGDAKSYNGSAPAAATKPAAAVAPAPAAAAAAAPAKAAGDQAALFGSLSKGLDVTAGLKKVNKSELSKNLPPPAAVPVKAPVAPRVNNNKPKGPPKCELGMGGKWAVECQDGPCEVEITNMKQMVYIYGCIGATITIKGKCKSITIDSCSKTKVYFDEVFASCEAVNSKQIHIQIAVNCVSLALDKVDGMTVFVPESSMGIEVTAAKISEINLQWNDAEGELVEKPIPEQYVHRIKDGKVTVDTSDLYSC